MNVLLIGSGGRESAIAMSLRKSKDITDLWICPGNGGSEKYGKVINLAIKYPFKEIVEFCKKEIIDYVVIGPEQPLVDGIVDELQKNNIKAFGPSKNAAMLEGSKAFLKNFLKKYHVPTADFSIFDNFENAKDYVISRNKPYVVKTDGLAAGKGAIVNYSVEETISALKRMFVDKEFGEAGSKVIVEEYMEGIELSVFVLCAGNDYKIIGAAQDHKRIFDDDKGPNTGGMGAYSPLDFITEKDYKEIENNIIIPTLRGMSAEGSPYYGILYLGLMKTKEGFKVVEYNVRFGDPEAQAVLPLIKNSFMDLVKSVCYNDLKNLKIEFFNGYCTNVVISANGYPSSYKKGDLIEGDLSDEDDVFVFFAGVKKIDNKFYTDGGRVLSVSAIGNTLEESIKKAYLKVSKIHFDGMHFRKDIGKKGLYLNKL